MKQRLIYKLRYWRRAVWRFFGRCHKCNGALNYTSKGRPICPGGCP